MNNIDVSNISDPNQAQPYFGKSLQFHQDATKEALNNLAISMIGASYVTNQVYVLFGCIRTGAVDGAGSGAAAVSAGAIFYNGEVYTVPAFSTANIAGQNLYSVLTVTDAAFDPSQFSNGVSFNVHNIRQWDIVQAGSGTNLQSGWIYLDKVHLVGTTGEPAYLANVSTAPAVIGVNQNPTSFTRRKDNLVINGYIKRTGGGATTAFDIFALPSVYLPTYNTPPSNYLFGIAINLTTGVVGVLQIVTGSNNVTAIVAATTNDLIVISGVLPLL